MKIVYLGHSCFRILGKQAELVTDPFTGIGLPEPVANADLVLCSHGHRDHSHVGNTAKATAEVLVAFVGEKVHAGIRVRGMQTYHDQEMGERRGANSVYVFNMDGLTLCHLGDLGHELGREDLDSIGEVDILFIPVGGFFTIGPTTATEICDKIVPSIIIPMHFRTARHSPGFASLSTADDFTKLRKDVKRVGSPELEVEAGSLPDGPTTVVLES